MPRALAPRRLDQQETLSSLNHWKATFQNYYRRCQFNSYFLQPGLTWNSSENNGGFTEDESSGLKRTPQVLAQDLEGFLQCLGGYLPFDYVPDKLIAESTDLKSVWNIIYEIYDVEINTTHFLDYASMTREANETYRGFFNRLVGFVRQHLPAQKFEAEGVKCSTVGETLTIGLLDAVTIHWLNSIDKRLVKIIKTEFSAELKYKRICQMVKDIAPNIDEFLRRYNQDSTSEIAALTLPSPNQNKNDNDASINMIVNRLERLESGYQASNYRRGNRGRNRNNSNFRNRAFCGHCAMINKQLGANLDTRHSPSVCSKKQLSVNVIETMESDDNEGDLSTVYDYPDEGETHYQHSPQLTRSLQSPEVADKRPEQECLNSKGILCDLNKSSSCFTPMSVDVSDTLNSESITHEATPSSLPLDKGDTNFISRSYSSKLFSAAVQKLHASGYTWQRVQKSKSPHIRGFINSTAAPALIDSGAEINVIDENVAKSANIGIVNTKETAIAANKLPLAIKGQTDVEVIMKCPTNQGHKMLNLGFMLVVGQLGVSCLIGQPGIEQNNIVSLPKQKLFILAGDKSLQQVPYFYPNGNHALVRSLQSTTLQPEEDMVYNLPCPLAQSSHVMVTPRINSLPWIKPAIYEVINGSINLKNSSNKLVNIKKR